jgi:hypothetical protein
MPPFGHLWHDKWIAQSKPLLSVADRLNIVYRQVFKVS